MSAAVCKSCGFAHGLLTDKRPEYYRQILKALHGWETTAKLGVYPPTAEALELVRGYVHLLIADDQGLCVACADKVVLP
jgi:hypothetical protein